MTASRQIFYPFASRQSATPTLHPYPYGNSMASEGDPGRLGLEEGSGRWGRGKGPARFLTLPSFLEGPGQGKGQNVRVPK